MILLVSELPTSGQFVAMWEHKDNIWSSIYKWQGNLLLEYQNEEDEFVVAGNCSCIYLKDTQFYVREK